MTPEEITSSILENHLKKLLKDKITSDAIHILIRAMLERQSKEYVEMIEEYRQIKTKNDIAYTVISEVCNEISDLITSHDNTTNK